MYLNKPKGLPLIVCDCSRPNGWPLYVFQKGNTPSRAAASVIGTWAVKNLRLVEDVFRIQGRCPQCNRSFEVSFDVIGADWQVVGVWTQVMAGSYPALRPHVREMLDHSGEYMLFDVVRHHPDRLHLSPHLRRIERASDEFPPTAYSFRDVPVIEHKTSDEAEGGHYPYPFLEIEQRLFASGLYLEAIQYRIAGSMFPDPGDQAFITTMKELRAVDPQAAELLTKQFIQAHNLTCHRMTQLKKVSRGEDTFTASEKQDEEYAQRIDCEQEKASPELEKLYDELMASAEQHQDSLAKALFSP